MSSNKKTNEAFYDGFHKKSSEQYRIIDQSNFTYTLITTKINKILSGKSGLKILDYGCGVGAVDFFLSSKNNEVTGLDISPKAIKIANNTAIHLGQEKNAKFYSSNVLDKIIKDKSQDVVLCLEVIEHVQDDFILVQKLANKLKKKGILILSTPSINAPLFKLKKLEKFDIQVGHLRRYDKNRLKSILVFSSLKEIDIEENEGIIRNLLFTNKKFGWILKFIKWKFVNIVTSIDKLSISFFGGSDWLVIAQK